MEKKKLGRGLEDVSKVFLSTGDTEEEKRMTGGFSAADLNKADFSHQAKDQCEIEETVTVRRRIAYHDDERVQENMKEALSEHLGQGYRLRRVELTRNEDVSGPRSRVQRAEEVTIFVKASPPA